MSTEQVKPGYKRTEVGVIPEDWEISTLRNLLSVIKNGAVYIAAKNGGIPISRIETISSGEINYEKVGYAEESEQLKNYKLEAGDLLFSHINSLDHIGKVAIYNGAQPLYHGMNLLLLRASEATIPQYLYYWLNSINGRRRVAALAKQAVSQASISTSDLRKFFIPIPKLNEQKRIAEILGDIDDLLAQLDRLITKKRDLKQAAMQQLLTGQTRLPGFSGAWEVKRLGDVGNCLRGVTYKGDSDLWPHDTAHTKRLLRSNNVQNSIVVIDDIQFVNSNRVAPQQLLRKNDILICMANGSKALVGKAGLFDVADGHEYTFGAFMGCFRTEEIEFDPAFVFCLFQTARYRDYINNLLAGSSINNLNPGSIESLEFHMPEKEEQTAIATVLSDMDAELAALAARRDKTLALKQGMMQELLTGRIRLV